VTRIILALVAVPSLVGAVSNGDFASDQSDGEASAIFGGKLPPDYRGWRLISISHEEGTHNDLRAILGNDAAITCLSRRKASIPG